MIKPEIKYDRQALLCIFRTVFYMFEYSIDSNLNGNENTQKETFYYEHFSHDTEHLSAEKRLLCNANILIYQILCAFAYDFLHKHRRMLNIHRLDTGTIYASNIYQNVQFGLCHRRMVLGNFCI